MLFEATLLMFLGILTAVWCLGDCTAEVRFITKIMHRKKN